MKTFPILTRNIAIGILVALSVSSANGGVSTPLNAEFSNGVAPALDRVMNAYVADGDRNYDIRLNFATAGITSQTVGPGNTLIHRLSYTSAINAPQFGYWSQDAGGHGWFRGVAHPFHAVADIVEPPGDLSGCIAATEIVPVPEASPIVAAATLLGIVCAGTLMRCRRLLAARI